ncbi:DMT family transporter [Autumnicola psychrophila]|uniref:DMT family transporter n=1 Tax=Autumnicola psychrophila TaxID=3075592 RepID=A0ABU3DMQ9_9FLAO|nr:DMT family transporter [Zunongwangia sp. F225]MDT0684990.1 DMT family transporter [Zunongwangia sp. F225]
MYLYLLMLLIGIVLAVHLAMNSEVGSILQNPEMGNAVFWCIGAITAIIIGFTHWDIGVFSKMSEVPIWLFAAGAIGAALVFGIAWIIPQIGAAPAFVLMICGQVIAGLVMSHFGLLGAPVEPISITKILGALLMIGGVSLVTFSK